LNPARADKTRGRRPRPGNALVEFILTLPIVVFVAGLAIYMSSAMLTRQQALIDARRVVLNASNTDDGWSSEKLELWLPGLGRHGRVDLPRGTGAELDQLRQEIYNDTVGRATGPAAVDYWARIWTNLPGRHETHASKSFQTSGPIWDPIFGNKTAKADHYRDSSPWHFFHLDAWRIARSGPCRLIFEAFQNNLPPTVAPHFKPTRDDIYNRWWHASDILDDEIVIP